MGLDYGSKRVGVALSDPMGIFAQPLEIFENKGKNSFLSCVRELVQKHEVKEIVLGFPRNMDGSVGPAAQEVEFVAEELKAGLGIPVVLWDERLSTSAAERMLIEEADMSREKRKGTRDKIAASLILQNYLDSKRP